MRGSPIELEPWQQFAFACILALRLRPPDGANTPAHSLKYREKCQIHGRRYLANWFLVMENGQQDIYTAAVSRDQARIVFDDARQMCLYPDRYESG